MEYILEFSKITCAAFEGYIATELSQVIHVVEGSLLRNFPGPLFGRFPAKIQGAVCPKPLGISINQSINQSIHL